MRDRDKERIIKRERIERKTEKQTERPKLRNRRSAKYITKLNMKMVVHDYHKPLMIRHMLASLDSVASAADGIK